MTLEENIKFFNNVYTKYPEEHSRIENEISREISYEFINERLLKEQESLTMVIVLIILKSFIWLNILINT